MWAKKALVVILEWMCARLDYPFYIPHGGCKLATWSAQLDERWNTGVWTDGNT